MTSSNRGFVIDTNVLVSAVLRKHSVPGSAFEKVRSSGHLLQSSATLDELVDVLQRKKFDKYVPLDERMRFVAVLGSEAVFVIISETIRACRDPKDDKFLELAVSGRAACIVTGDDGLLTLSPFREIPIMTPAAFLDFSFDPPTTP